MLVGCSAGGAVTRTGRWCARAFRIAIVGAIMATSVAAMGAEPSAADKETARNLMNQGDASYASKDFEAALRSYVAADQIMGVPTTGVEVAKAQEALGKLVEARDTLLQVMRYPKTDNEPRPFVRAREQATERARKLAERIPSVTVLLSGLGEGQSATVRIDGTVLHAAAVGMPRKLNPGKHTIKVTASGFADERREIDLPEGAQERVAIELQPGTGAPPVAPIEPIAAASGTNEPSTSAPTPVEAETGASTSTSSLTYIGFGLAGVGITAGAITGALAYSKTGTAKDQCLDNVCPSTAQSDIDSAKSMGTISTVSFAVGLVGAAVGVYGLMNPSEPEPSGVAARPAVRWQPTVGLGNVGVVGQF
jgi:hypothetical protein